MVLLPRPLVHQVLTEVQTLISLMGEFLQKKNLISFPSVFQIPPEAGLSSSLLEVVLSQFLFELNCSGPAPFVVIEITLAH